MSAVRLGVELMSATDLGRGVSEVEIKPCTPLPTPCSFCAALLYNEVLATHGR